MKANRLSQTLIRKLILTGLKLAVLIGGVAYFLSAIISTYAHVIYYEETVVPDDFVDGTFIYTGLNASLGSVQLIPIGLSGQWLTQTAELPEYLTEMAAVIHAGKIFVIGGYGYSSPGQPSHEHDTIYSATINTALTETVNATNTLFEWVKLDTTVPITLRHAAAVIYPQTESTSTLYVLGGWNSDDRLPWVATNTVYYATVDKSTGEIGEFKTTSRLPKALFSHSALIYGDTIYVIGGWNSDLGQGIDESSDSVYSSTIQPDGTLSTWQETSSLPPSDGRAHGAAVLFEGPNAQGTISRTIYYVGGAYVESGEVTGTIEVYYTDILPDKSLLNWTESYSGFLPFPLQKHGAVVALGEIFLTGGMIGQKFADPGKAISSTVKAALVDLDDRDRLYNWCPGGDCNRWVTGQLLPQERSGHASVEDNGEIWVIGGVDESQKATKTVYHGTVHGTAARYAPHGSYLSNKIYLGQPAQLKKLVWEASIPYQINQMSITMQCRYSSALPLVANWQDADVPLASGTRVYTYTFTNVPTDTQYFQYKADFYSTLITATPRLNWVRLYYDVPNPDVAVSKEADKPYAWSGDYITYTIHYTAGGGVPAQGVVITETVPENTAYVERGYGWQQVGSSNTYTYFVGTIGITGTYKVAAAVDFVVLITTAIKPGIKHITDVVRIDYPPMIDALGGTTTDTVTGNNVFTHTIPLLSNLIISKTDGLTNVNPGETITYTITYTNIGQTMATGIVITENLSSKVSYVGYGWTPVGNNVYIRAVPSLWPGKSAYVKIFVRVPPGEPPGQIDNYAEIRTEYAYDSAHDFTDVNEFTKLEVYKTSEAGGVRQGENITYTIFYTNVGNVPLTDVVITDTLPLSVTYESGGCWPLEPNRIYTCPVGSLNGGQDGSLEMVIDLTDTPTGTITNTVEIRASGGITDIAWARNWVFPPGAKLYDLYVVSIATDPERPLVGQETDFIVKVANLGGTAEPSAAEGETVIGTIRLPSEVDVVYIWVGLYVDPPNPPQHPDDHSDYIGYVYLGYLWPGYPPAKVTWTSSEGWGTLPYVFDFTGGHTAYAQVDVWAGNNDRYDNPSYGRIPESDEINNIMRYDFEVSPSAIFLPIIVHKY